MQKKYAMKYLVPLQYFSNVFAYPVSMLQETNFQVFATPEYIRFVFYTVKSGSLLCEKWKILHLHSDSNHIFS